MLQVLCGKIILKPASFSTGFHGKSASPSATGAHFGKTGKLSEKHKKV